jgi:hypothetical protein
VRSFTTAPTLHPASVLSQSTYRIYNTILGNKAESVVKARIDFKYIKENKEQIISNLRARKLQNVEVVDDIIQLVDKRAHLNNQLSTLNKERKNLASSRNVELGRSLRQKITDLEHQITDVCTYIYISFLLADNHVG